MRSSVSSCTPEKLWAKGLHLGDEHDLCHFHRDGIAYAHTMALQYLMLQEPGVFIGNACGCQDAKAGIDAVHGTVSVYDLLHMLLAGQHFALWKPC